MDMKSILTTLDVINQPKPADIVAEDEIEEELTLEEFEALEEDDELEEAMVSVDDFDDRPASNYKLKSRSEDETGAGTLRKSEYEREDGEFTEKQIKMAFGILNDPRYKGGNLTAAIEAIEGIAPGLSEHPAVQRAMLATMESVEVEEGLVKPDGEVIGVAKKEKAVTKPSKSAELEPRIENEPRKGIYGTKKFVKDDDNELSDITRLSGLNEKRLITPCDGLEGEELAVCLGAAKEKLRKMNNDRMGRSPKIDPRRSMGWGLSNESKELSDIRRLSRLQENDMVPYADPELDFEGDMAKNQLARIMLHAEHLSSMLEDNENMPEWVQSKITKALDYISTAHDYLMGEEYKD